MKTKMTNRQKQAIRTKNKIFNVTVSLISEKGLPNVNIEDICKAADVSIGTFYNYYKSKNEVFYELYIRADHFFEEKVHDKLEKEISIKVILDFFDYYAIYCEKTGVGMLTQMMVASNKNFARKGRYMQVLLIEILEKALKAGLIESDKGPEELCDFYFMIARGVIFDWCLYAGEYNLRKKMRECLSAFIFS